MIPSGAVRRIMAPVGGVAEAGARERLSKSLPQLFFPAAASS